jgi:translation initiation factor 1
MKTKKSTDRVVYSTEQGRMCPECGRAVSECICSRGTSIPKSDGVVRVSRETKGRKGKGVTIIKGLALDAVSLTKLGKNLRTTCGAGGTVKDGVVEIQGDHTVRVVEYLKKQGWNVKRAGG